jgi:Flp pilus assembly protein TadD
MNRKERRAAAKQAGGKTASASVVAKIDQAIAFAQAGDLAKAEALLDPVAKSDPDLPEVNHQLGMVYVRTGRTDAGLQLLRKAVAIRPEESLYWNNLGAACLSIERSQEAVDAVKKALAIDAKNFMAWQNLGLGQRDLGDRAAAAEAFDRANGLGQSRCQQPRLLGRMSRRAAALRGSRSGRPPRLGSRRRTIRQS